MNDRGSGLALILAGGAAIIAIVLLALFFTVGGAFGPLNDAMNGVFAFLAGEAAWSMRRRIGQNAAILAMLGAVISIVGAALVLTATTGFLLAGFVSSVGFALIGPAVLAATASYARDGIATGRLALLGRATGWLFLVGLVAIVPVALRLDDMDTLPAWAWLSMVAWIGTYFTYPIWAIALGRRLRA